MDYIPTPFLDKLKGSWAALLAALLLITLNPSFTFAQDRNQTCDSAWTATQGHIAALEKPIKQLKDKIAQIDSTTAGLRKIYNPDAPKASEAEGWKEKMKRLRMPRLKGTKETITSTLALLAEQKKQLQSDLKPLEAKLTLVKHLATGFQALKAKPDQGMVKQLLTKLQAPLTAAQAKVTQLTAKAQLYDELAKQGGDWSAERKEAWEAVNTAKAELTFWSQHQAALKKLE